MSVYLILDTQYLVFQNTWNKILCTKISEREVNQMNKAELLEKLSQKIDQPKKTLEDVVDTIIDTITEELSKGEEVAFSGFGTFSVKDRKARQGVNPKTGEKIQIAASKAPKFKAGKRLKEAVK